MGDKSVENMKLDPASEAAGKNRVMAPAHPWSGQPGNYGVEER
jgi:hypothetical protein